MEEQGPQFSKPDPPANPGKAVSPKLSNRTRLSLCTFIHILYFGIFQRTGRDSVGQRLRQEGEGGLAPHFPHIPPGPATWGAHTQGEGRHRSPLGGGGGTELHPRYTHTHTHTHTHPHEQARSTPGGRDHREAERCGVKGREATVSSQTGGRPLPPHPTPFPVSPEAPPPYALPGHSLLASSFFPAAGDEKKRGTEQGGVHPSAPFLMLGGLSPGALRTGS